jgi:hypothetical protein
MRTVESAVARPTVTAARVEIHDPEPAAAALVKQPAMWFAVAGWAVALILLFRRRSI